MKAGIGKLLRTGKNKMILDLAAATGIQTAGVLELGRLNQMAGELEGEIVVIATQPGLISDLGKALPPQKITCTTTLEQALKAFKSEVPAERATTQSLSAQPELVAALKEIGELKEKIRALEGSEIAKLKREAAMLRGECETLRGDYKKLWAERKHPASEKGYLEKIRVLEKQIEEWATKPPAP
jgi:anti-anti-sigma regulatory factor